MVDKLIRIALTAITHYTTISASLAKDEMEMFSAVT